MRARGRSGPACLSRTADRLGRASTATGERFGHHGKAGGFRRIKAQYRHPRAIQGAEKPGLHPQFLRASAVEAFHADAHAPGHGSVRLKDVRFCGKGSIDQRVSDQPLDIGPSAPYLKRSFTRSVQVLVLGECRSPDFLKESSSSFSSLRWCSVIFTGVSTDTWQYRSPG